MFSVDNFYTIFNSHYGWDKTQVMPYKFNVHGSKNFNELVSIYNKQQFFEKWGFWNMYGSIILHDQEPLMINAVGTYCDQLCVQKKSVGMPKMTVDEYMTVLPAVSIQWPIFCHSEENSPDVQHIKNLGIIDCHYFWHGFIARDWFRHWQHHADITIRSSWSHRFLLYARSSTGARQYRQQVIDLLQPIRDQIKHDWDANSNISSDASATIDITDCDTAIHIVAETVFDQRIHLTEKIFKPVAMLQPFIVFAGPGSLRYLQRYGFQTFDSVWDESYDDEVNDSCRLKKVIKLIYELNSLDTQQFQNKLAQCQQIVLHNQQHFFSNQFEKILMKELDTNIKISIGLQQAKVEQDPGGPMFKLHNRWISEGCPATGGARETFKKTIRYLRQFQPLLYARICKQYHWVPAVGSTSPLPVQFADML